MPLRHVPSARLNRAARRAMEEGRLTFALLAELTGRTERHWRAVAAEEGWRLPDGDEPPAGTPDPESLERRLIALSDELVNELEVAARQGRASGTYDKSTIDALSAMMRMVEKLSETTRVPERAAERQNRSDAELAAALALIDARILELASELAASMGGQEPDRGGTPVPAA